MKKLVFILFRIFLCLFLLLFAALVFVESGTGKKMLADWISRKASQRGRMEVRIERIRGWLPVQVLVDRVGVADATGEWIVASGVAGRVDLGSLMRGKVRLTDLSAETVVLGRLPDRMPEKTGGQRAIPEIQIDSVSIKRLEIDPAIAGEALALGLHSDGILFRNKKLTAQIELDGDVSVGTEMEVDVSDRTGARLMASVSVGELSRPMFGLDHLSGRGTVAYDVDGWSSSFSGALVRNDEPVGLSGTAFLLGRELRLEKMNVAAGGVQVAGDGLLVLGDGRIDADFSAAVKDPRQRSYGVEGSASWIDGDDWLVEIPSLRLTAPGFAPIKVEGVLDRGSVALNAEIDDMEIRDIPFGLSSNLVGQVGGKVRVSGSLANPVVVADIGVSSLSFIASSLDEMPRLDFHVVAGISNGTLSASTAIAEGIHGFFSGRAAMPCELSLNPPRFSLGMETMDASCYAVLDLGMFNGLAMLDNQRLEGIASAELEMKSGVPSGFVQVEKGIYEHYGWGLVFNDIKATIDAFENGFRVREAKASDGRDGRLWLTGAVRDREFDVSMELSEAAVVRRPEVQASLSGKLDLTGTLESLAVGGRLVVDRADLLPDNLLPGKPVVLEDYDARLKPAEKSAARGRVALPIGLDVVVEMPDQIYVNASLIDSVWGGALRLKNDPSSGEELQWVGSIEPRRGFVDFVGRQFRWESGSLAIDSAIQPVPVMNNLTAEYSRSDISARLILNGRIDRPECRLESIPALPEDEILAHILFRRDASTITPYQALQIANAAKQLSSGLSGPGFLYQVRQAIGVDTLEFRESGSDGGSSSIAAGKYVTPELYVEVNSSLGSEAQMGMSAEYEMNSHFSVETSTGPALRPGIGINWRNDY